VANPAQALARRSTLLPWDRVELPGTVVKLLTFYDLVVVVLVILLAWRGFRAGLVGVLLAWLAFGVGLALAFRFDRTVGALFARSHALAPTTWRVVAFVVILVVVEIAAGWLARVLSRTLARVPVVGGLNRVGGVVLGALLALVVVWFVTAVLLSAPAALLPFAATVRHSETARLTRELTPHWQRGLRAYIDHVAAGRP